MADCCAELRSELAALRAEVAKLGKIDEESIVQKAVKKAESLLKPEILSVSGVAIAAGVKATSAYSLGEIASVKAGNAFSAATAAGKVTQVAQGTATAANATANAATLSARVAQATATAAGTAAAAANAFAASAFGKAILAIANIAVLVGSIAGLFSLYATLQVVFPRLDAHDRELQMIEAQLAKDSSSIFNLTMRVRTVEQVASEAKSLAESADYFARNAVIASIRSESVAREAQGKATTAVNKADEAISKAATATREAELAQGKATTAVNKAEEAISEVATLKPYHFLLKRQQINWKLED